MDGGRVDEEEIRERCWRNVNAFSRNGTATDETTSNDSRVNEISIEIYPFFCPFEKTTTYKMELQSKESPRGPRHAREGKKRASLPRSRPGAAFDFSPYTHTFDSRLFLSFCRVNAQRVAASLSLRDESNDRAIVSTLPRRESHRSPLYIRAVHRASTRTNRVRILDSSSLGSRVSVSRRRRETNNATHRSRHENEFTVEPLVGEDSVKTKYGSRRHGEDRPDRLIRQRERSSIVLYDS